MSKLQKVTSVRMAEGEGAEVNRLFPTKNHQQHHDPFVLMDEFIVKSPAEFSQHEHRGFEAVTYMLEGSFVHNDNLGHNSEVKKGGAQVFNAGKSLYHSEKPGSSGYSRGIQLWVNLPQSKKDSEPYYQSLEKVPVIDNNPGMIIRQIFGPTSPLNIYTEIKYLDIELDKGQNWTYQPPETQQGILYLQQGQLTVNNLSLSATEGILFPSSSSLKLKARTDSRFLIVSGDPHQQNMKIRGSFVE